MWDSEASAGTIRRMGVLPDDDEARRYVLGPGSVSWRIAGDARLLLSAGAALVLQVAHPTVGAGVHEHSDFERDPWGRLLRTLDFMNLLVFGGPEAAIATGRGTRAIHRQIKGVLPDGRPYHSLEPEAYAWVHATLAETIVSSYVRFVGPLASRDVEAFWQEWRGLGRLLGVRKRDLPATWADFGPYVDRMARERLEDNETVRGVLRTLRRPTAPPLPLLGDRTWGLLRIPAARAMGLGTVGLLPEAVRARLGLHWTAAQERELALLGRASRLVTPLAPRPVRQMGPTYLRLRGDALPVAPELPRRQRPAVAA